MLGALPSSSPLLHAVTHHVYPGINVKSWDDVSAFDRYKQDARWYLPMAKRYAPTAQPWAGENGPAGGGEDATGGSGSISGTFASALWYADALAVRASIGYVQYQRQDLFGGTYGLLALPGAGSRQLRRADAVGLTADFWVNFLWKRLMGPGVRRAELDVSYNGTLRAYAHSGPPASHHAPPELLGCKYTALLVQLDRSESRAVRLEAGYAAYVLTPGAGGPLSADAPRLNGAPLPSAISSGESIDAIPAAAAVGGPGTPLVLPPLSIAFVAVGLRG